MAIAIEVENLKKRFAAVEALKDVSLRFEAGLMHGVIGPEGAGKTTLFRHLTGLLRSDSGCIRYFQDQNEVPLPILRPKIAYMPQQQSLYSDLSIGEHLDFFRELYALGAEEYEEKRRRLLHITRLGDFIDRPAGQLSGGMYKKLGLMCALLASPLVLLLDEPTNGVDPISRRDFWDLLYQLQGEKILVIVATAYMDEAERCARVHLLDEGRVIGSGEPKALLEHEHVRGFDELFLKRAHESHERGHHV